MKLFLNFYRTERCLPRAWLPTERLRLAGERIIYIGHLRLAGAGSNGRSTRKIWGDGLQGNVCNKTTFRLPGNLAADIAIHLLSAGGNARDDRSGA